MVSRPTLFMLYILLMFGLISYYHICCYPLPPLGFLNLLWDMIYVTIGFLVFVALLQMLQSWYEKLDYEETKENRSYITVSKDGKIRIDDEFLYTAIVKRKDIDLVKKIVLENPYVLDENIRLYGYRAKVRDAIIENIPELKDFVEYFGLIRNK